MELIIQPNKDGSHTLDKLGVSKEDYKSLAQFLIENNEKRGRLKMDFPKDIKTLEQNNLYWVLIQSVCDFWKDCTGETIRKDVFDEMFRLTFFSDIVTVSGTPKVVSKFRVSNANRKQMSELIDKLITQVSKNPSDGEDFALGLDLTVHPSLKNFNSTYK